MTNPQSKTVLNPDPYIILDNRGELTPSLVLSGSFHKLGRGGENVDLSVPSSWTVVSRVQACFRRDGQDYIIYDGDGTNPSSNRLYINNSCITPKDGYKLENGDEIKIGQDPANQIIIRYYSPSTPDNAKPLDTKSVSLLNRSVTIGRDPQATLILDAPTISRIHAVIDKDAQNRYILQDRSVNGVFVNGQKVSGSAVLNQNSDIRIGPYRFTLKNDELVIADYGNHIRIDAENLSRMVRDRNKKAILILNSISLPIEPGQFVAIVGGSGAGKSTLLKTLLGIEPTTSGKVYLNGEDLRANFNIYRSQIGYVPQSDIVHRDLTVAEVLHYSSRLRLPPDADRKGIITKTLKQVSLSDRRDTLVRDLSGGQLKRVSIAVELLADPKLFFLDEPTSGLDPGLDKKMMTLLQALAKEGRTIVLVTHATDNINMCDRLVFLGQGGNLCYFGPPRDAISFFSRPNFADIYIHLETEDKVYQESQRFLNSPEYLNNIESSLGKNFQVNNQKPAQVKANFFSQLQVLTERYFQLFFRDKTSLLLYLITAPLGILLMSLVLREQSPLILEEKASLDEAMKAAPLALKTLFVLTCASLWLGLACSLQEIVKEAAIYARERLVNLGLIPYLFSKLIVLSGLAAIQSLFILIVTLINFQSPEANLLPWFIGFYITTFLTIFASINLGLMISAAVKNITQANSSLPLILIPQIIFAGVLFNLTGPGKYLSWLTIARWAIGSYGILVGIPDMIATAKEQNIYNLPLPFDDPNNVYALTATNLLLNWGLLILHSLIYFAVTYLLKKRGDVKL